MNLTAARATPGWMHEDELAWLAEQAATAQTILEVGCWQGRSTLALADNTPGIVYAVDTWCGTPGDAHLAEVAALGGPDGLYAAFLAAIGSRLRMVDVAYSANNEATAAGIVVPMRMTSVEGAKRFPLASLDLVFIDAGHEYQDVARDLAAYRPLVRPGGILAGHDYGIREHAGVQQAVDEVFPQIQRHLSIWWVRV